LSIGPFSFGIGYHFEFDGDVCFNLVTGKLTFEGGVYGTPIFSTLGGSGMIGYILRQIPGQIIAQVKNALGLRGGGVLTIDRQLVNIELFDFGRGIVTPCTPTVANCKAV
jgi:hypothetical protein